MIYTVINLYSGNYKTNHLIDIIVLFRLFWWIRGSLWYGHVIRPMSDVYKSVFMLCGCNQVAYNRIVKYLHMIHPIKKHIITSTMSPNVKLWNNLGIEISFHDKDLGCLNTAHSRRPENSRWGARFNDWKYCVIFTVIKTTFNEAVEWLSKD